MIRSHGGENMSNVKTVTLAEIAKTLKINAKVARRRLRSAEVRRPKDGWVFPSSKRGEIVKIVKG
jgi:hypothetical protein